MQRYYFHLHNDLDVPDDEGLEFPDLAAARACALHQARALIAATVADGGRIVLSHRIDVEDEQHLVLDTIAFGDVVEIQR